MTTALDIGSRRELFVDRHLIDCLDNARLVLNHPAARGGDHLRCAVGDCRARVPDGILRRWAVPIVLPHHAAGGLRGWRRTSGYLLRGER